MYAPRRTNLLPVNRNAGSINGNERNPLFHLPLLYEGELEVTAKICTRCKKNEAIAEGDSADAKWYAGRYCAPCLGEIKAIQAQRREYDARWRREAVSLGIHPDMPVKDAEREAYGVFKEDIYDWGNDWDRR